MNGPHDMGGFDRFGPVNPEKDEPVFHTEWERRAFAINLAVGMTGTWNIDEARHARECLEPLQYWSSSYYQYRHYGLERQLIDTGLATAEEIASGRMQVPARPVKRVASAAMIPAILKAGGPANRASARPQGFRLGDNVRVRNNTPAGHTRMVRYARGHAGEVVLVHGTHVLPDSSAHGRGDDPHWLYTVRFTAKELWGRDSRDAVCIDLWEPYLEAV